MNILKSIFGSSGNGKVTRNPYKHSPQFVHAWERLPDSIAAEYETSTLFEIATRHSTTSDQVAKKLRFLGVQVRRQSNHPPGRKHPLQKLSPEQIAWALEQDDKNVTHAEIGRELGVTRERIRQICFEAGKASRRSRQTKTIEIKEAAETRMLEKRARLLAISESWKAGATLKELNDAFFHYSHPYAVSNKIAALRERHPDLFPHRMKKHGFGTFQSPEEIQKMSELWVAGKSKKEIADAIGYKTSACAAQAIKRLRGRFPRMFPPRRNHGVMTLEQVTERRTKFAKLWKANKPAVEIMEAMGYKNVRSVYQAATNYRKRYPDQVPLRATSKLKL